MNKTDQLPIYYKTYMFTKLLYQTVHNMPKEYKFTLGQEAINLSWKCLDLIIEANVKPNSEKQVVLKELSVSFDKLKLRLRMMHEIDVITLGQFTHWQENYTQPIGEQLGGWLRWAKPRTFEAERSAPTSTPPQRCGANK